MKDHNPDLYRDGVCVYRLCHDGSIFDIAAWSTNTFVAFAAFDYLVEHYPDDRYSVRRRGLEYKRHPPASSQTTSS